MSDQQIINPANLRKWRIELPNLYDDAGLDPYEFRLLVHYVRVGNCFESTRTTAEKCNMSIGKVSITRKALEKKGFIQLGESEFGTTKITVIDQWEENFKVYSECSPHERRVHDMNARSPHEQECSPHEPKNDPLKNHEEEDSAAPAIRAWASINGTISPFQAEQIAALLGDWEEHAAGLPDNHPDKKRDPSQVILSAVEETGKHAQSPNIKYLEAVVKSWMQFGFQAKRKSGNDRRPAAEHDPTDPNHPYNQRQEELRRRKEAHQAKKAKVTK